MATRHGKIQVQPGLLRNYSLAINTQKLDPRETNVLKRIAGDQQMLINREMTGRMFVCAALNLYALILYRIGNEEEAIRTWESTLKVDPSNINALHDLVYTYEALRDTKNASKYMQDIENVENGHMQTVRLCMARCKAEKAYARLNDLQMKTWDCSDARREQVKTFEEALASGGDIISEEEKRDWLLYKGQTHEKLARTLFRERKFDSSRDSTCDAFKCLWECLQKSQEPMHKAQAWCALGNTFTVSNGPHKVLKSLKDYFPQHQQEELCEMVTDPQRCYKEALELDEENKIWILARLGLCQMKSKDEWGAQTSFDKCINAAEILSEDNPMKKACRLAYDYRAMLYVKKSKSTQRQDKKREYLDKAMADTKKATAISLHPNPFATSGEVHYLLAQLEKNDEQRASLLENALIQYHYSFKCQDGQSNPFTHRKLAKCQEYMRNFESAAQEYQATLDLLQGRFPGFIYATEVAEDLLHAILKDYRTSANPNNLTSHIQRLRLVFFFIKKNRMQRVIYQVVRNGYFREFVQILHQVIDTNAQMCLELVGNCLNAVANIPLTEDKVELLSELSYDYQVWKASPQVEEDQYPQTAVNKAFDYDFYVISDDSDSEVKHWVKHKLLPQLGNYGFKGYYHSRDSKLGEPDTVAQATAMKQSCYIFTVITSGFCGNQECLFQTEMACKSCPPCQVVTLQLQTAQVPRNLEHFKCFDFTGQDDFHQLAWYMYMNPQREE